VSVYALQYTSPGHSSWHLYWHGSRSTANLPPNPSFADADSFPAANLACNRLDS
jgi:hypothetical protein